MGAVPCAGADAECWIVSVFVLSLMCVSGCVGCVEEGAC